MADKVFALEIDHLVIDFSFPIQRPESGMPTNTWETRMRFQSFAALLFCGLRTLCPVEAQSLDQLWSAKSWRSGMM